MSDPDLPKASMRGDYQPPPGDPIEQPTGLVRPLYTLYSPKQIGTVAFFGGPVGACVLFWSNYRRLGEPTKATTALVLGVLGTLALGLISMSLPESVPRFAVPIAYTLAIAQYAKASLGRPFQVHLELGGKQTSSWAAFGIAVASLALTFGLFIGIVLVRQPGSVQFGKSEVFYTDGGTRLEAQHVGDALIRTGYFAPGHGASVTVERSGSHHVVAFVMNDSMVNNPLYDTAFKTMMQELSRSVFGGEPVDIWINDDHQRTKQRIVWEPPADPPVDPLAPDQR
jgi:hypothetical protein